LDNVLFRSQVAVMKLTDLLSVVEALETAPGRLSAESMRRFSPLLPRPIRVTGHARERQEQTINTSLALLLAIFGGWAVRHPVG